MSYTVELSESAVIEIKKLRKAGEKIALKKIDALISELEKHPYTGTGKPKPLGGNRTGQWSRHITNKHRLVYVVEDKRLIVFILSASGHYEDK
jgi:toxin YoeB